MAVGWHHTLQDSYPFRQAQTALTVDTLLHGAPWLAYETPVFGPPWSLPLEFPLYQWLVALAVKISGSSIESAGRMVSVAFFYLALFPANAILRRLGLAASERRILLSLLLVSPLYIFYSRTVMIESAALFLGLAYLACVAEYVTAPRWLACAAGTVLGALGASVKITTFLGFGIAAAAWLLIDLRRQFRQGDRLAAVAKRAVLPAVAFGLVPFVCLSLWTRFADAQKSLNPLTAHFLTSGSLTTWNFGTLSQRFTSAFWFEMMPRTLANGIGGLPVALAALALLPWVPVRHRVPSAACVALFLASTMVFTNLHVVHTYYPYGTAIFLVAAVGWIVLGLRANGHARLAAALFVIAVGCSELVYFVEWFPRAATDVRLRLPDELQRLTRQNDVVLIYGQDWSSETAFYSHRRALMDRSNRDLDSPEMRAAFKELSDRGLTIGAIVVCQDYRITSDFVQTVVTRLGFVRARIHKVPNCLVYVPEHAPGAAVDSLSADNAGPT
jgi:hypothetical protein